MINSCTINSVMLMGRLTADPELKQTQGGKNVCQFTVAVNRRADKSGNVQADFINIVTWDKTAEFVSRYFSKGRLILIEGTLRTRTYNDRKYSEVKHYVTEVYADNVSFGESKSNQSGANNSNYQQTTANNSNYQQTAVNSGNYQQTTTNNSLPSGLEGFEEVISDGELPF